MVTWRNLLIAPILWAQASQDAAPMIKRLTPLNQIRVIVGLFVVVILGLVIFLVIKAGAHMFKGFSAAANRLPSNSLPEQDDWATKPLNLDPSERDQEET